MATLDNIDDMPTVAAVLATTEFAVFDKGATARTGKATGTQVAAYLAGGAELFGGGTGVMGGEGNINVQAPATAVSPGATAADNVLAVYSIPAGSFSAAGKMISITASGSFAANGNNKTVKIIVNPATAVVGSTVGTGGTTICSTAVVATNGAGWQVQGTIIKQGAAGANTQLGIHEQAQIGAAVASMLAPSAITATESGAILVAITGNAATTATDILFNALVVNACN